MHFHKIVQNEHYGYPDEWFPSVSATIGDRYPERSFFQIFIAITSGPRFALVFLWYLLTARPNSALPKLVAGVGGGFAGLAYGGDEAFEDGEDLRHDGGLAGAAA